MAKRKEKGLPLITFSCSYKGKEILSQSTLTTTKNGKKILKTKFYKVYSNRDETWCEEM